MQKQLVTSVNYFWEGEFHGKGKGVLVAKNLTKPSCKGNQYGRSSSVIILSPKEYQPKTNKLTRAK